MKKVDKMSATELRNSVTRLRKALVAIYANSAPMAAKRRPRHRIHAIHKISDQVLAEEE